MPYSEMAMDVAPETGVTSTATGEELCKVGLAYSTGVGVDVDMVEAHKWFNLAVLKGSEEARDYRQQISDMLSSEEVKLALKSARDWLSLMN
jgi:TPR repeat protein